MTSHPYRTPRWAWTALLLIWAVVLLVDEEWEEVL